MLKRRRRERMNVRPPERVRSEGHMQWVRGHECAVSDKTWFDELDDITRRHRCDGKVQSHHVRVEGQGTTGEKPGDDKTVALCDLAHREGHRIGWKSFEAKYRVDLTAIARELWARSPHRVKHERKMREMA